MNTHRWLSLTAAIAVTVGQALVFAVDTAATDQVPTQHADPLVVHEPPAAATPTAYAAGQRFRHPGWRGV